MIEHSASSRPNPLHRVGIAAQALVGLCVVFEGEAVCELEERRIEETEICGS